MNLVEVDQSNPSIVFEESLSNGRVTGLERVSSQANNRSFEAHRVIAAINGDVWAGFSNDAESAPNGLDVEAGELITARDRRPADLRRRARTGGRSSALPW